MKRKCNQQRKIEATKTVTAESKTAQSMFKGVARQPPTKKTKDSSFWSCRFFTPEQRR